MDAAIRDAYLQTQIVTATPQRLRLMLIEETIRRLHAAQAAFAADRRDQAAQALSACREVLAELLAGVQPDQSPVARRVQAIYVFLYSTLVEAQFGPDPGRLPDMLRVLEEERLTWQAVCEQMPHRPAAVMPLAEELAPQRVQERWSGGYASQGASQGAVSDLSIEA
jgi:flagellar protein FliS